MQEFSSISVSSYEAGSLAEQLTEQSRDGWSVVAIVPTGSTVTAYLCREADGESAPAAPAAEQSPEPTAEPAQEPAQEPATSGWGAADTEPALAAIVPDPTPEPSPEPATSEVAPEPAATEITPAAASSVDTASADTASADAGATAASTAGAAPAGWYADPSGRFELRYWDGGQWTEHVSRAGQQYTDPPVA